MGQPTYLGCQQLHIMPQRTQLLWVIAIIAVIAALVIAAVCTRPSSA